MYMIQSGKNVLRKILPLDCYDMTILNTWTNPKSQKHASFRVKAHEEEGTQENL